MKSLRNKNLYDMIDAFNSTSRYLGDLLNMIVRLSLLRKTILIPEY